MTTKNIDFDFLSKEFIQDQVLQEIDQKIPENSHPENCEAFSVFKDRIVKLLQKSSHKQMIEIKRIFENSKNLNKRGARNKVLGIAKDLFQENTLPSKTRNFRPAHCIC